MLSAPISAGPVAPSAGWTPPEGPSAYGWANDLQEAGPERLRSLRRKRMAFIAGGVLAVLLVIGGLVYALRDPHPAPVIVAGFEPHDAELSTYLLPAPAGAAATDGELTESDAAQLLGDPHNIARYKFTTGRERSWEEPGGEQVTVRLLRFRGAENTAYFARDTGLHQKEDSQSRDVSGIPGGWSVMTSSREQGLQFVAISAAAAGDVAVFVLTTHPQPTLPTLSEQLLTEQWELL